MILYAGLRQIGDLSGMTRVVDNYRLLPASLADPIAIVLSGVEIVTGFCLIAGLLIKGSRLITERSLDRQRRLSYRISLLVHPSRGHGVREIESRSCPPSQMVQESQCDRAENQVGNPGRESRPQDPFRSQPQTKQ